MLVLVVGLFYYGLNVVVKVKLCFFCNHPGLRLLDSTIAKRVVLGSICEAHIDYQFFYQGRDAFPGTMTPRQVMAEAEKVARESLARMN